MPEGRAARLDRADLLRRLRMRVQIPPRPNRQRGQYPGGTTFGSGTCWRCIHSPVRLCPAESASQADGDPCPLKCAQPTDMDEAEAQGRKGQQKDHDPRSVPPAAQVPLPASNRNEQGDKSRNPRRSKCNQSVAKHKRFKPHQAGHEKRCERGVAPAGTRLTRRACLRAAQSTCNNDRRSHGARLPTATPIPKSAYPAQGRICRYIVCGKQSRFPPPESGYANLGEWHVLSGSFRVFPIRFS